MNSSPVTKKSYVMTIIHPDKLSQIAIHQCRVLLNTKASEKRLGARARQWYFNTIESDLTYLKQRFKIISEKEKIDIVIHQSQPETQTIQLAVFDMDSTLIQSEVIDELAKEAGVIDAVKKVTEAAMQGRMDFCESLTLRLKLLAGLDESALVRSYERIRLTSGAERLFKVLHARGCKTAIISGGFTWFARRLQKKLGIDHVVANSLEIAQQKLTGRIAGHVVDDEMKKASLLSLSSLYAIHRCQTIATGDGANDIPMLQAAGMGIAFHAKAAVKNSVEASINYSGLDSVLYLIGLSDDEIDHVLEKK